MCKPCIFKEIAIYLIIVVVLAFMMHPDLLSNASERFAHMQELNKYSHPFIYSFIFYVIVFIVRFIISKILTSITGKKDNNSEQED
jgi:biotin transporter BioY